jgi:hypothetical protein
VAEATRLDLAEEARRRGIEAIELTRGQDLSELVEEAINSRVSAGPRQLNYPEAASAVAIARVARISVRWLKA